MVGLGFFLTLYTTFVVMASSEDKNETATIKHQLKQLEETVAYLQKHILASERKQTAVLSSVLSRLTETTKELDQLQHNYTVLENKCSSSKDNKSCEKRAEKCVRPDVAFEAIMKRDGEGQLKVVLANSIMIFSTTKYNKGGCWNSSNGVFTAPANGTYMFWIDLTFTGVVNFTLSMKRNQEDFGKAFGSLKDRKDTAMTSLIALTQLIEGDRVKFLANNVVTYFPLFSSCGGILLHSDIHL